MIKKKSKKGQFKIQEMSFMLVAVVLFFILVGLFALSIFLKNMSESANELMSERAHVTALGLAESAEFTCWGRSNCIDEDKLIVLINNKDLYKKFWKEFGSIEVLTNRGIFNYRKKNEGDLVNCSVGNLDTCDRFVVFKDNKQLNDKLTDYVALCRLVTAENNLRYEKCEIGEIVIGVNKK